MAELASCDSATAASSSTHLAVSIRGLLVQFDDPALAMGCWAIHGAGARGGANSQLESGIKCKKCGKGAKGGAHPGIGPGGKKGYVPGVQGSTDIGRYIWGLNMAGFDGEDTLDNGELLFDATSASLTVRGCISW